MIGFCASNKNSKWWLGHLHCTLKVQGSNPTWSPGPGPVHKYPKARQATYALFT